MLSSVCKETFICLTTSTYQCIRNCQTMSSERKLKEIFLKSVKPVQPENLIKENVQVLDRHLVIKNDKYVLQKPCHVIGFGKAVLGMALELERQLGAHLQRALLTVPHGIFSSGKYKSNASSKIQFIEGARNNLPDEDAMNGAEMMKYLVEALDEDDLLIVLISGGGSALLPLPIPPIKLHEKQKLIRDLARRGANIVELNTIRKQMSLLKGGGLATLAYPCKVVSLILSDIVGDPLDFIASGPTTPPQPNLSTEAINIIQKYRLYDEIPDSIKYVLQQPKNQFSNNNRNTVTPIANGQYEHVGNYIIGNNKIAAQSAKQHSLTYGYQSVVVSTVVDGDVDKISYIYANVARNIVSLMTNSSSRVDVERYFVGLSDDLHISRYTIAEIMRLDFSQNNICLIFGGEPTVVVNGNGLGGRNQQLALAFSVQIEKCGITNTESVNVSFLSCGTDGIDGPTDAAGAIGTLDLVSNSHKHNLNPIDYLENNDSYRFFQIYQNGCNLVKIGHTGTNVMDIHLLLIERK